MARTLASAAATVLLSASAITVLGAFGEDDPNEGRRDRDRYARHAVDAGIPDAGGPVSVPSECIGTRLIDHDDRADLCAGVGPAACGRGEYRVDERGLADRCLLPNGTLTEAGCAPGFSLQVRAGRDECTRSAPPSCPERMRLRVQKGEDDCVPEAPD